MSLRNFSSVAVATTLSAGINASTTSVGVAAVTGWPSAPFLIRVDENTASEEVMLVTAVVGTTLTVTRGYDSTVGVSHSSGATVAHCVSAIDFREANAHVNASTGVHGLTGAVVGTTDTQTLSGKTLSSPTITDLSNATHDHLSTAKGGLLAGYVRTDGSSSLVLGTSTTTFTVQGAASQSTPILTVQDSAAAALVQVSSAGVLNTLKALVATAGSAATVPLTAKGAATQTANLQEWQSSASAVLASVDKNGKGTFTGLASTSTTTLADTTLTQPAAGTKGLVVKAAATPSVNIFEVQDSAATRAFAVAYDGIVYGALAQKLTTDYGLVANAGFTTVVPAVVNGVTGQTADLQQWQVNGSTLASVDKSGNLSVAGLTVGGVAQKRMASGTTSVTFTAGAGTLTYGSLGFTPSRVIVTAGMGGSPVVVGTTGVPGATSVTLGAWATAALTAYTGTLTSIHWIAVE